MLDTSTLIRLADVSDPSALPDEPLITAVTLAELSVGPLVAGDERERELRQAHLQQAEASFAPLPFDASAARAFGRVAASLRRSGRKVAARTYDAMIAATAVAHELPVYTANPPDFIGIDDLIVVEVPLSGKRRVDRRSSDSGPTRACYDRATVRAMRTITHRQLRNQSAAVLRDVEAGESLLVSNNGSVIARISPASESEPGLPVSRPATTHDFEDVPLDDRPGNVLDALGDLRGDR